MSATPSPEAQIRFLQQFQRILSDGAFVATYKFALLHALADLSVIRGDDTGAALRLSTSEIAEQIIELYWRQAAPFPTPHQALVLRQNTGRQAAILNYLRDAREACGPSLAQLRRRPEHWRPLVRQVDGVLREMPLWKLQTVGEARVDFLYENLGRGTEITLRPGVAYCFRAFYDLVTDLVRGAWLRFVRAQNAAALGDVGDLSVHLFGSERASLTLYLPILMDVQEGACFYCGGGLRKGVEVDHFVPWSRYPMDLGHNFVLAHAACNQSKSDHLAAEPHLERWIRRNELQGRALSEAFGGAGIIHDQRASHEITRWAYAQVERIQGPVWLERGALVSLSSDWPRYFGA